MKMEFFGIAIVYLLCGANIYLTFVLDSWFWDTGKGFDWWLFVIFCTFWPLLIFDAFSSKSYEIVSNTAKKMTKEVARWCKSILQRY